jgi:hypothetical protein
VVAKLSLKVFLSLLSFNFPYLFLIIEDVSSFSFFILFTCYEVSDHMKKRKEREKFPATLLLRCEVPLIELLWKHQTEHFLRV